MEKLFSGLVTSTAFKYLIAMVASWVASKLGVEQLSIEGILTQAVALVAAGWGVWEASRNKIVIDGEKAIVHSVDKPRAKTLIDMIKNQQ